MSTFLELVNQLASEGGTVPNAQTSPMSDVTGITDDLKLKVISWIRSAWLSIQNAHREWLWMQSEFYGSTVASTARYAGTSFNDAFALSAITRFSQWDCSGPRENRFKLYLPADGLAGAGRLQFEEWPDFYAYRMNNGAANGKPSIFSIDPQNRMVLSPTPDDVYTVIGPYRKSSQTLTSKTDVPEMPVDLHDVIVSVALELLGTHDEAPQQIPLWKLRQNRLFCELEAQQLPRVRLAGPLA